MNSENFSALWQWLDTLEQDVKTLRLQHPGMPDGGLMVEILQLRAWATNNQPAYILEPASELAGIPRQYALRSA